MQPVGALAHVHTGASRRRPGWQITLAAMSCSLAAHAALLLGVRITYDPVQPFPREPAINQPAMMFVELATVSLPPRTTLPPHVAPGNASKRAREERQTASSRRPGEKTADENSSQHETSSHTRTDEPPGLERHPLTWSGFRDPRLRVGNQQSNMKEGLVGRHSQPFTHQLRGALELRIAADQERTLAERQITILGQRVTVFGDSSAYHSGFHWNISGRRATLPVDGRDWEDLQMRAQRDAFVRDSLLRERLAEPRFRRVPILVN